MKRVIRFTVIGSTFICALALLFGTLQVLGILSVFYLRRIDNEPLNHPQRVVSVIENVIKFDDGRIVEIDYFGAAWPAKSREKYLRKAIHEIDDRLDMEVDQFGGVSLYGTKDLFICRMGRPLLEIPLVPIREPRYERRLLGYGRIVESLTSSPQ